MTIGGRPSTVIASSIGNEPVDLRYVFLVRASARLVLVESGDFDLGMAVDGLIPVIEEIIARKLVCPCVRL